MTEPGKPGFVLPVIVTLAVILGVYVGAYYALVKPAEAMFGIGTVEIPPDYAAIESLSIPWEWPARLFAPVHWVDVRLRPKVWRLDPFPRPEL